MKKTILIADDSAFNRALLKELLQDRYDILEAEDGERCIELFSEHELEIALVLLDVFMPNLDGFETLSIIRRNGWLETTPVIMVSSETSPSSIARSFELGAHEYITRPFEADLVSHRVDNAIRLYRRQDSLLEQVARQMEDRENNNSLMVSILSEIVEFRNGESGLHVLHINKMTEILLRQMMRMEGNPYELDPNQIEAIAMASSLHDVGKMAIPDTILNKPGRYTPAEFAVMKTHAVKGAEMIERLGEVHDAALLKVAYQICRWHHERYDGRGYPDGLVGEQIPLSAQVVGLADVYDALTSKRVYKDAYTHETAINMIFSGDCGAFNPDLLRALIACEREIQQELGNTSAKKVVEKNFHSAILNATNEAADQENPYMARAEEMKQARDFLMTRFDGLILHYRFDNDVLRITGTWCEAGDETHFAPKTNQDVPSSIRKLLEDAQALFTGNGNDSGILEFDYFGKKCTASIHAGRRGQFAPPIDLLIAVTEAK